MNVDLLAANLTAHWLQAGLLAAVALLALAVFRVRDSRLRMAALQTMLWLIVLVPWVQPWPRGVPAARPSSIAAPFTIVGSADPAPLPSTPPAPASTVDPIRVALAIVAAGIAARLSWLAYGGLCLVRFRRTGRPIPPPDVAAELEQRLRVSPRYLEHAAAGGPSTFGFISSTIAVPAGFAALDPTFQRAIICHELVHVRRRDTMVALVEELITAALWFHPWMWVIRSRIRLAREQVVDRAVLGLIGDPAAYVRCLVELSGHDLLPHLGTGMLGSRELRARIDAMFQEEAHMSRRRMIGVSMALAAVAGCAVWVGATRAPLHAMAIAEIHPAVPAPPVRPPALPRDAIAVPPPAPAAAGPFRQVAAQGGRGRGTQPAAPPTQRARIKTAYAEYPLEALEKGISGTVIVNIAINAAGDVTSAGVVSGPQELRASAFKAALGLKYAPGPSTAAITLSVEFLLDRQSWGVRIADRAVPEDYASLLERARQAFGTQQTPADGPGARLPSGAYRIGGAIQAPRKIKDVMAIYPPLAQSARVQGVVIVEATIDPAGNVSDVRVLRSIPLLDSAAVESVKQWQYAPTIVDGVAVPVVMTATVNFTLRDSVRLKLTLPNGSNTVLVVPSAGGLAVIDLPGTGQFEFATDGPPGASAVKVSITDVTNGVRRPIGSVDVAPDAGVVPSATTPSFGIAVERLVR